MSDYGELLDDLDAWAMVQPRAAKAIRSLLRERDHAQYLAAALALNTDGTATMGELRAMAREFLRERDDARAEAHEQAKRIAEFERVRRLLPGCMIGPSDPCDMFQAMHAERDALKAEVERLRAEVEHWKQARNDAISGGEILKDALNAERQRARLPEELAERLRTAIEFDLQEQFGGDLVKRLIEDVLAWQAQQQQEDGK